MPSSGELLNPPPVSSLSDIEIMGVSTKVVTQRLNRNQAHQVWRSGLLTPSPLHQARVKYGDVFAKLAGRSQERTRYRAWANQKPLALWLSILTSLTFLAMALAETLTGHRSLMLPLLRRKGSEYKLPKVLPEQGKFPPDDLPIHPFLEDINNLSLVGRDCHPSNFGGDLSGRITSSRPAWAT